MMMTNERIRTTPTTTRSSGPRLQRTSWLSLLLLSSSLSMSMAASSATDTDKIERLTKTDNHEQRHEPIEPPSPHLRRRRRRRRQRNSNNRRARHLTTQSITLHPTLDATILESSPTSNRGHAVDLSFLSPAIIGDTNSRIQSILKFDIDILTASSEGILQTNGLLQSAQLRLYANEHCGFGDHPYADRLGLIEVATISAAAPTGIAIDDNDDDEFEMSIDWEDANPPLSTPSGAETLVKPLGELRANSWFELDVTSLVVPEEGEVTLRIGSVVFISVDLLADADALSSCSFASKECEGGRFAPELVLQVETPPPSEPISTTGAGTVMMKQTRDRDGIIARDRDGDDGGTMMEQHSVAVIVDCAPRYVNNRDYVAGEVISNEGRNYECKSHPYTIWCGAEAYEPGVGLTGYWAMAWERLDECQGNGSRGNSNSFVSSNNQYTNNGQYTYGKTTVSKASSFAYNSQTSSMNNECAPQYQSRSFAAGDVVSNNGKNYECKSGPQTAWCSIEQYAPGTGVGHMAWIALDPCGQDVPQGGWTPAQIQGNGDQGCNGNDNCNGKDNDSSCPRSWELGRPYEAGEWVTSSTGSFTIYECKEYPFTASCGDPAAKVGEGPIYENVWRVVGRCTNGRVEEGSVANSGTPLETSLSKRGEPTRRPTPNTTPNTRPIGVVQGTNNGIAKQGGCGQKFRRDGSYSDKDIVSSQGSNYECSLPRWCGMPKFEPGRGKFWTLVWEPMGACTDGGSTPSSNSLNTPQSRPTRPNGTKRPVQNKPATSANLNTGSTLDYGDDDDQPCPPLWVLDYEYSGGETVGSNGQIFRCKESPQSGWCGSSSLYEPDVGHHWDMAWDMVGYCVGAGTRPPTPPPVQTPPPTPRPTPERQTSSNSNNNINNGDGEISNEFLNTQNSDFANDDSTAERVFDILDSKSSAIDTTLFLYQGSTESEVYRYEGFVAGLRIMYEDGVAGKHFYLGNADPDRGHLYGLVNIAAFIGQSMKETIQYDACDENSWDFHNNVYPLSNACGQLGQSYQDYHCPEGERHMECEVDPNMSIRATTHAKWFGAPGPMFCGPKSEYPETGIWDYNYACDNVWAEPSEYCTDYEGQRAGRYDNSVAVANRNGRTDVEGCCWWGRGVIQTTGVCNFGKLNYFLGKRAHDENRDSRYPDIDFCQDPGIICSSKEHKELKWIAGLFYWIESLQSYDERGWNYMNELHNFVDGGMADHLFIDAISGIVNRGCHDPPCGTGEVDGKHERAGNFQKVLSTLNA